MGIEIVFMFCLCDKSQCIKVPPTGGLNNGNVSPHSSGGCRSKIMVSGLAGGHLLIASSSCKGTGCMGLGATSSNLLKSLSSNTVTQ